MAWDADLSYDLLDTDGTVVAGFVPMRSPAAKTSDPLSGVGAGKCAVLPPVGADVSTIANDFRFGRYVRVNHLGSPMFTWRIEDGGPTRARADEEGYLQLSGKGWGNDWRYGLVRPYGGITAIPKPDNRIFNFASADFPNGGAWTTPVNRGVYGDPVEYSMLDAAGNTVAAPANWLDPLAQWIWPMDPSNVDGEAFFRATFLVTDEAPIGIAATGDNYYTVYLDGVPVLSEEDKLASWTEYKRVEKVLPPGIYTIGVAVRNPPVDGIVNVAGMLFSLFTIDAATGEPDTVLLRSEATPGIWTCTFVDDGDPAPGWNPFQILDTLLGECQAQGECVDWTFNFDATEDTEGASWNDVPHYAVPIGSTLLDALQGLSDQGWIEYHFQPGAKVLDGWMNQGGWDPTTGTSLRDVASSLTTDGSDVTLDDPDFGKTQPFYNRYLVRYPGGLLQVDGDLTDGVFAAMLTTDARDAVEAQRNGERAIYDTARTNNSITWKVTPIGSPSTPYVGFGIRAGVGCPNEFGVVATRPVVAITCIDETTEPRWQVTWQRRRLPAPARQSLIVDTLGSSVLGDAPGSVAKSSSGLGAAVPSQKPILDQRVVRAPTVADFPSGPPGGGGAAELVELPPFSFAGLIRNLFADDMRTTGYVPTEDFIVDEIVVTLADLDSAGTGTGPIFKVWENGVAQYTSPRITANLTTLTPTPFTLNEGNRVWCTISDDGLGDAIGLGIHLRRTP